MNPLIREPFERTHAAKAAGAISEGQKKPDTKAHAFGRLDEDPRVILFGEGAAWLSAVTGKPNSSLRSTIGQMLKTAGHDDASLVLAVLRDAKRRNVAEPISWIMAVLKARSPNKGAASASIPSNFKLSKPAVRA